MALNIKNLVVERLAAEVAGMAQETKTEAIRKALVERKQALSRDHPPKKKKNLQAFLERHVWPLVPPEARCKTITKEEEEEILGIGPHGY